MLIRLRKRLLGSERRIWPNTLNTRSQRIKRSRTSNRNVGSSQTNSLPPVLIIHCRLDIILFSNQRQNYFFPTEIFWPTNTISHAASLQLQFTVDKNVSPRCGKLGKCFSTALLVFTEFVFYFFQCFNTKYIKHSQGWTNRPRFMKFGMWVHFDNTKVDIEGQGHGSKVKVTKTWPRTMYIEQKHVQPVLEACQHTWQVREVTLTTGGGGAKNWAKFTLEILWSPLSSGHRILWSPHFDGSEFCDPLIQGTLYVML